MSTKVLSKACLLSLIAAASLAAGAANAGDRASKAQPGSTEVTGAIDPRAAAAAAPSPIVGRAQTALDRFLQARAAMEHGLLLRDSAPKRDIAAVQSSMQDLRDNLAAIEQMDPSGAGASAKEARALAEDWFRAGMDIMAPPASGLTAMPLPMLVSTKAEQVATSLDWLVAQATANAAPAPTAPAPSAPAASAAPASTPATPTYAAVVPAAAVPPAAVRAAPAMRPATPTAARPRMHVRVAAANACGHGRLAHPKPMTQNEASARLFIEGLPLFLPPAALFIDDREHCQP